MSIVLDELDSQHQLNWRHVQWLLCWHSVHQVALWSFDGLYLHSELVILQLIEVHSWVYTWEKDFGVWRVANVKNVMIC